jgi:hypothetical protein
MICKHCGTDSEATFADDFLTDDDCGCMGDDDE